MESHFFENSLKKEDLLRHKESLKRLYLQSLEESDANKKGGLFEEFVRTFFRRIKGFDVEPVPLDLSWTDLDVVIFNNNEKLKDAIGPIIVVQCKNRSDPISWKIIAETLIQAIAYGNKCKTAILATTSHLTGDAKKAIDLIRTRLGIGILVIEDKDWQEYFNNSELNEEEFIYSVLKRYPEHIYK